MPVSENHKTIFIHIPKTGGTSVEFVLGMHGDRSTVGLTPYLNQKKNYRTLFGGGLQHLNCSEVLHILNRRYDKTGHPLNAAGRIFSRLRSPFLPAPGMDDFGHILEKYYIFSIVRNPYDRLVSEIAWSGGKWKNQDTLKAETFRREVTGLFASGKKKIPGRYRSQYTYIMIGDINPVHDIFRFEDFKAIGMKIREKFRIDIELPHRMKSRHRPWEEYYDTALREMVYHFYHKDFETFGYDR